MRFTLGLIFLLIGLAHGIHVAYIDPGFISNLNGTRFFSFEALDRLAASSVIGKFLVLAVDGGIMLFGFNEMISAAKRRGKLKR